jgi:hypothetical protein
MASRPYVLPLFHLVLTSYPFSSTSFLLFNLFLHFAQQNKPERVDVRTATTMFHALPTELWLHLCSFLDVRDFVNLCSTSRDLRTAGQDEWVWRTLLLRDCPSIVYATIRMTSFTVSRPPYTQTSPGLEYSSLPQAIDNIFGQHNVKDLFGRSWQWIYRSKMVPSALLLLQRTFKG